MISDIVSSNKVGVVHRHTIQAHANYTGQGSTFSLTPAQDNALEYDDDVMMAMMPETAKAIIAAEEEKKAAAEAVAARSTPYTAS